jgi:uncharacterized membrane protein YgaE (UPF0421/DUF939 family)
MTYHVYRVIVTCWVVVIGVFFFFACAVVCKGGKSATYIAVTALQAVTSSSRHPLSKLDMG